MLGRRIWRSVPLRRRGHEGKPFRYPLTARIVHKARVGAEKSIAIFHSLFPSFQLGILSRLLLLNGTIPPTVLIVHRWPCHSAAAAVMLSVNVVYLPREKNERNKATHRIPASGPPPASHVLRPWWRSFKFHWDGLA